jgi:hypothetical protein
MSFRSPLVALLGVLAVALIAVFAAANGSPLGSALTISGAPGNGLTPFSPLKLTTSQLAALPQQTVTVSIDGASTTESGPLLSALLTQAGLQYISACKNDELRYWIDATGANGSAVELTAGEIDPGFGNKPAILSVSENGSALASPRLIVPGDASGARDIRDVTSVAVGRAAPQLAGSVSDTAACTPAPFTAPVSTTPPDGTVVINGDVAHPETLTYAQLAALPQVTQTDSFLGPHGTSTNTETGPTLFDVVSTAGPRFGFCAGNDLRFYVEVSSSEDGYASLVSWAEIDPRYNGNPVLLSLTENGHSTLTTDTDPRLTVPGDVHGGRYVSGAAVITVLRAPREAPLLGCGLTLPVPLPSVTVPGVTVPGVTVPGVTVPGVTVPIPPIPPVTVPTVTVPNPRIPVTVTTPRVPAVPATGDTVPSGTTPTVTAPTVTVPDIKVPAVTVPAVKVP